MAAGGSGKVIVRRVIERGNVRWKVDANLGGKRVRRFFKSQAEANREADGLREQLSLAGAAWMELTPIQRAELLAVAAEMKTSGTGPRRVWEDWQRNADMQTWRGKALRNVCIELLQVKTAANRRQSYLDHRIASITRTEIEEWLATPMSISSMI